MADLETSVLIKILDAFTGPLRKLDTGLGDAAKRAESLKSKMELAAQLNQAAEASGRFGMAILGPMKGAVDEFVGFERAMSRVSALSDQMKGTEGFERLKAQALELGAATRYSAQEVAEAQGQYAQAGRSVDQIVAMTPMTIQAAIANQTSIQETAAIVGHVMSGMGIEAKDTAHTVDVLTAAAAASDMSLTDLGTAMAYVGPVARQANVSVELTAALLGKMKDAGLEASSAGTGLRAVFARLLDPSKEAQRAFGKLGVNLKELKGLQQTVASGRPDLALRRIGEASAKLPNEQRMKLMSQIFGMEASTAANVAITASMDVGKTGIDAAVAALRRADGTTARLATVMDDNLGGALERAGGAISGLKTQLGEVMAPTVDRLAGYVGVAADVTSKLAGEYPNATRASLELAGNLGLTALALKGVLTAQATYLAGTVALQKAYGALSGSLLGKAGLIAASFGAGYAVGTWINETFGLTEKIMKLAGLEREYAGKRGTQAGEDQVYSGGWKLSGKTGEVLETGWGKAPARVQQAVREGGAKDVASINAWLRAHPVEAAPKAAEGAPLLPDAASAPGSARGDAGAALAAAAASGAASDPRVAAGIERMDKKLGELVDHMRRGQRVPQPLGQY